MTVGSALKVFGNVYGNLVLKGKGGTAGKAYLKTLSSQSKAYNGGLLKNFGEINKIAVNNAKFAEPGLFQGGVIKSMAADIKSIPAGMKSGWAGAKGFGKVGAALKPLGKAVPIVFTAMMLASEVPNIVRAAKDKGLIAGVVETGKAGLKLGAGFAGAALLSGIPFVGPIVGFMAGNWLATKIVGKSHSEKKAEQQQQQAQMEAQIAQQVQAQMQAPQLNPFLQTKPINYNI